MITHGHVAHKLISSIWHCWGRMQLLCHGTWLCLLPNKSINKCIWTFKSVYCYFHGWTSNHKYNKVQSFRLIFVLSLLSNYISYASYTHCNTVSRLYTLKWVFLLPNRHKYSLFFSKHIWVFDDFWTLVFLLFWNNILHFFYSNFILEVPFLFTVLY